MWVRDDKLSRVKILPCQKSDWLNVWRVFHFSCAEIKSRGQRTHTHSEAIREGVPFPDNNNEQCRTSAIEANQLHHRGRHS
jgi:hypothetical protein